MIALCNDVDQRSPHIRAPFAGLCRGRRRLIGAPTRGAQVRRTTKRANWKRGNTGGRKERQPAETLRLKQNLLRDNYRMDGRRGGSLISDGKVMDMEMWANHMHARGIP